MELDISEKKETYDEYNQNNRLVNDINYSYYLNKNQNLQNNQNNNDLKENNKSIENNKENNNNKISNPYNRYNYNSSSISSTIDINANERQRKNILLNNIQAQMNLRKKTKLEELQKAKEEDVKYLREMIENYPFGRGGGGAPIRNKKGEVQTFRRNLISNYKYNRSSINIDDDFDEVWGKRKNNVNNNININNRYNPNQRPFSTINENNNLNNFNNRIRNNNYNINYSYDFNNNYNINYNNDLDNKIYERRMKLLELQKEQEEIKNEELKEENKKLENALNLHSVSPKKKNFHEEIITETENENETTTNNDTNIINNLKNIKNANTLPSLTNSKDYYDNINFVPKSKINQRLDNNFLFTEELSKLRKDMEFQQASLLKQISELKDDNLLAKNQRNKVYKDLELIKYQINELNENKISFKEKKDEDVFINEKNVDENYNSYNNNLLNKNDYDDYYDYYYINDNFFSKYEKELPYNSQIKKEKKIFHLEKNYEDKNMIELDKLIKKSNDIMQNFRENELIDEKFRKKPEDYFDTSDYFFDTYMLKHKNDYLEYANEYKNKYGYLNTNNKFIEFNSNNNDNNNTNDDYEINIEKI